MRAFAILRGLLLALLVVPLYGCPQIYKAGSIEAWVVDSESGAPIEGVIVVANWQLFGGLEGGVPQGSIALMETVTDARGHFRFPGWGPRVAFGYGHLRHEDPALIFFKRDYRHLRLTNDAMLSSRFNPLRSSRWDGQKISMARFQGSLEDYIDTSLAWYATDLNFIDYGRACEWRSVPGMLQALSAEKSRVEQGGARNIARITGGLFDLQLAPGCGDPRRLLEGQPK